MLYQIERTPRRFRGRWIEVSAILPAIERDFDDATRLALNLSPDFRERSVIEAFVRFHGGGPFERIANGDYHTNILVSDALLNPLRAKLYSGAEFGGFTPFRWKDITDAEVIGRFALRLETRFVGYIKQKINEIGLFIDLVEPGLFVDLLGFEPDFAGDASFGLSAVDEILRALKNWKRRPASCEGKTIRGIFNVDSVYELSAAEFKVIKRIGAKKGDVIRCEISTRNEANEREYITAYACGAYAEYIENLTDSSNTSSLKVDLTLTGFGSYLWAWDIPQSLTRNCKDCSDLTPARYWL